MARPDLPGWRPLDKWSVSQVRILQDGPSGPSEIASMTARKGRPTFASQHPTPYELLKQTT